MAVPASALQETRSHLASGGLSQAELDMLGEESPFVPQQPENTGTPQKTSPLDEQLLNAKKRGGGRGMSLTPEHCASPQQGISQEELDALAIGQASPKRYRSASEEENPSSPEDNALWARKVKLAKIRLGLLPEEDATTMTNSATEEQPVNEQPANEDPAKEEPEKEQPEDDTKSDLEKLFKLCGSSRATSGGSEGLTLPVAKPGGISQEELDAMCQTEAETGMDDSADNFDRFDSQSSLASSWEGEKKHLKVETGGLWPGDRSQSNSPRRPVSPKGGA